MTAVDTRPLLAPAVDWQQRALAAEQQARAAEDLLDAVLDAIRTECANLDAITHQPSFRMAATRIRAAVGRLNPLETP